VGQATQFFVNNWQQGVEGSAVAALPAVQKLRNSVCRRPPHEEAPGGKVCALA
jgi:hypothetical protein